ncbi:MAG TPA: hypothetical protein VH740_25045 [Vicinamibacterales bacterium]|jgi:hypothetical protein
MSTMVTMSRMRAGIAAALLLAVAWPARAQEPARTDGWVVLALNEYRELRARAFPTVPDPLPPPVDATLTRIDYELRVNGDTVTGEARLTIDVLKQGWVSLQMPAGLLVRSARLEGRPTALLDGKPPRVLVSRAGRSTLALDIVVPIESASGIESMTLPSSASALSAVTLIVPRTGIDLSVSGGFVAEQTEANAENRWVVFGSPGRTLRFSWKRKVDDRRSTMPLRAKARITELVALGEDASPVTASVNIEVVQGLARDVVLTIPDGVSVNQVTGVTVADWKHEAGTLTVSFLEPIAASTSIVVSAETRAPREGSIAIPIIRMPAAEREIGGIAVDVIGAGEITERHPRGVDPADPADLGDILEGRESPSMVAFGFKPLAGNVPRALTVSVSRYTPQAVLVANVEEARYEALAGEDGKLLVRARYAVRNNQRAFLALKLPQGSVLWSAALAGRPIRPGLAADGGYLLPLVKGRAGETAPTFSVELVYLQRTTAWTERGDARLELPAVDLPVSRTGLTFKHSPRFAVEPLPGAFRAESPHEPWSAVLRMNEAEGAMPAAVAGGMPPAAPAQAARDQDAANAKALVDRFRKDMGRTSAGTIPVHVTVPNIGPSFFVAAELTAESHAPALDVRYKRVSER